jgi:outer membrane lipoprotein
MKATGLIVLLLLCGACASKPSTSVGLAEVDDIPLGSVRESIDAFQGTTVRWGGIVSETENKADHTLVFVVARQLKNKEKPDSDSASDGRFVARFNGFIDPQVYKAGRPLTVVGPIDGSLDRPIGEYDYRFPIVAVRDSHLWADPSKEPKVYYYPDPWFYNSFHYHYFPHQHPRW